MSDLDPTRLLFQLDTASALALFWYVLLFDLPRYTLVLAIVASELLRERQPPGAGTPGRSFPSSWRATTRRRSFVDAFSRCDSRLTIGSKSSVSTTVRAMAWIASCDGCATTG